MKKTITIVAAVTAALLAGCSTTSMSGSTYTGAQLQQAGELARGTVLQVRNVIADRANESNGTTMLAGGLGALVGGALANNVGKGNGKTVATTLGAAAGGVAGAELSKMGSKVQAWEIIVQLDNGKAIPITQEADQYPLQPGQKVYVIAQNGRHRVVPSAQ